MMYLGIDVGGTNLKAGLIDSSGTLLHKATCPVDQSLDAHALCRRIALLCQQVIQEYSAPSDAIQAVGVGLPGCVDAQTGVVLQTPNMPFHNTPFRDLFRQELDLPVYLGNDANCAALGEYRAGAAQGYDPALVITLGTGVGGGLVIGGQIFSGAANSGMEVGHMVTHPDGEACGCGHRGCWEQYASATALIRMTRQAMAQEPDSLLWSVCQGHLDQVEGRTPFHAAQQGDPTALQVVKDYVREVAVGLVNLVNILQPQIICLGGGISNAPDALLLEPLQALVHAGCFDPGVAPPIVRAALGNDAGLVGAAMLCR